MVFLKLCYFIIFLLNYKRPFAFIAGEILSTKNSDYKKNSFYPNLIKKTFDEIEKEYGIKIIYN